MTEIPDSRAELDGSALPDEPRFDESLRPRSLDEMVGQVVGERVRLHLPPLTFFIKRTSKMRGSERNTPLAKKPNT